MPLPSTLNPWQEKGIPLDQQIRSWKQIALPPYHKREVDAYSRGRVILMNGIGKRGLELRPQLPPDDRQS